MILNGLARFQDVRINEEFQPLTFEYFCAHQSANHQNAKGMPRKPPYTKEETSVFKREFFNLSIKQRIFVANVNGVWP